MVDNDMQKIIKKGIIEAIDSTELVAYQWMNKTEWEQQEGKEILWRRIILQQI